MKGYVYAFYRHSDGLTKIGMSVDYRRRFVELHGSHRPIQLVAVFASDDQRTDERAVHLLFRSKRVTDEWFQLNHGDYDLMAQYFHATADWRDQMPLLPEPKTLHNVACQLCGKRWQTKLERPKTCVSCHSYEWDTPRCKRENWNNEPISERDECETA